MNSAADNKIIEDWACEYGIGSYGEQCADTDGLAVLAVACAEHRHGGLSADIAKRLEYGAGAYHALAELEIANAKLTLRAEQAERNLERTIAERDALRTELNQRMAIPAQALKRGNFW